MATVIYSSCASSKKAESAKAKTEVQKVRNMFLLEAQD